MDKHIAAEAAVETFRLWFERIGTKPSFEDVQIIIQQVPAADVEPVVHAHWIDTGYCGPHHMIIVQCSACKKESEGSMDDMRCPKCGAHMDGEVTQDG